MWCKQNVSQVCQDEHLFFRSRFSVLSPNTFSLCPLLPFQKRRARRRSHRYVRRHASKHEQSSHTNTQAQRAVVEMGARRSPEAGRGSTQGVSGAGLGGGVTRMKAPGLQTSQTVLSFPHRHGFLRRELYFASGGHIGGSSVDAVTKPPTLKWLPSSMLT